MQEETKITIVDDEVQEKSLTLIMAINMAKICSAFKLPAEQLSERTNTMLNNMRTSSQQVTKATEEAAKQMREFGIAIREMNFEKYTDHNLMKITKGQKNNYNRKNKYKPIYRRSNIVSPF